MDDKVLIDLLVQIAACEEEREAAAHTVGHHADRERHLRELQDEYREDAAAAAAEDRSAAVRLRAKESEIRAAEADLALRRDRTVGITDRRRYRALQDEIAALEARIARLEDEALALLDAEEAAAAGSAAAADDARRQADRGGDELARLAVESDAAGRATSATAEELARLVALLPPAVRRHVERLHAGDRRAVVRVESGACGGCFGQLPAQQGIDADKGRAVVRCAGCARYVVHRPWH